MAHYETTRSASDAATRGTLYRLLATVFLAPPRLDLLLCLRDSELLDDLAILLGEEAVADLREFALSFDPTEDLAVLKQEYMDLFAVPTAKYVTPFEDVYRGECSDGQQRRGPLLGQRAIAARRIYRQAGAEMDRQCAELPTHAGVELSFMSFLCEHEASTLTAGEESTSEVTEKIRNELGSIYRSLQEWFLQEHLTPWFPQLSSAIRAHATTAFYRGIGALTKEFLASEVGLAVALSQRRAAGLPVAR